MADGKIAIDLDKISEKYSKKANGTESREKEYDLDTLYNYDAKQTLLERMQKRGQMSMMDIYLLNKMERDEKRETMQQNPQNNVEDIIRRSQEPLLKQIEEMKQERERERQEAKYDKLEQQIMSIRDLLANGNGKKPENEELLKKFDDLNQQLRDEKEKAREKEQKRFQDSIADQIERVNDAIDGLRHQPQSKDRIDQLRELNQTKKELMDVLGIKEQAKEEEAGIGDLVDTFADKGPKIVKTISTMRDAFKGEDTLLDDVPPMGNIPTNLPERARARENKSVVPPDIKAFLDSGNDTEEGYKDISGVTWKNKITGVPLHKTDLEDLAITDPEQLREIMKQVNEDVEAQRKQKHATTPKPKQETSSPEPEPTVPEAEKEQLNEDAEQVTTEEENEDADALEEAMTYIDTGTDKEDENGVQQWVGQQDETYMGEQGMLTKAQMIEEAKKDPAGFMRDVQEHLGTLDEEK